MRKRFFVYVLASAHSGKFRTYVGWTHDLDTRVEKHNNGHGAKATRGRAWILFYAERHKSRIGAMRREWALKHDRAFRELLREGARDAFFQPSTVIPAKRSAAQCEPGPIPPQASFIR